MKTAFCFVFSQKNWASTLARPSNIKHWIHHPLIPASNSLQLPKVHTAQNGNRISDSTNYILIWIQPPDKVGCFKQTTIVRRQLLSFMNKNDQCFPAGAKKENNDTHYNTASPFPFHSAIIFVQDSRSRAESGWMTHERASELSSELLSVVLSLPQTATAVHRPPGEGKKPNHASVLLHRALKWTFSLFGQLICSYLKTKFFCSTYKIYKQKHPSIMNVETHTGTSFPYTRKDLSHKLKSHAIEANWWHYHAGSQNGRLQGTAERLIIWL